MVKSFYHKCGLTKSSEKMDMPIFSKLSLKANVANTN